MAQPNYEAIARAAAQRAGIDEDVFVRQMRQESGLRPGRSSGAGAQGIAQIMPATARSWGVDPNDPVAALNAAASHMGQYVRSYKGDYAKALAAYNAGPGAVQKYGGVPPYAETQHYVQVILNGKTPQSPSKPQNTPAEPLTPGASTSSGYGLLAGHSPTAGLLDDGDFLKGFLERRAARMPMQQTAPAQTATAAPATTKGGVPARRPNETGQQYLDRVLMAKFGLKHDPGNAQTTGGHHADGSYHYKGQATDFGDARNDPATLQAAENYVEANADALGIAQSFYGTGPGEAPGHANHAHFATLKSLKPSKKVMF